MNCACGSLCLTEGNETNLRLENPECLKTLLNFICIVVPVYFIRSCGPCRHSFVVITKPLNFYSTQGQKVKQQHQVGKDPGFAHPFQALFVTALLQLGVRLVKLEVLGDLAYGNQFPKQRSGEVLSSANHEEGRMGGEGSICEPWRTPLFCMRRGMNWDSLYRSSTRVGGDPT